MSKLIDLTGQRFGRLTVIKRVESDKNGNVKWLCVCDCGNSIPVLGKSLHNGRTQSCGCLKQEILIQRNKRHGFSATRLYNIWKGMRNRTTNKNCKDYEDYGKRGIKLFPPWENFVTFRNWALSNGYRDDLSIDRIDVNGNYEPSNCRWVDTKTQHNNTRQNHYLFYDGQNLTIAQWAEILGLSRGVIKDRIRYGWSVEETLTTPVGGKRKTK